MICWSLWVSLSWLGILFPVIFTYVHPQLQDTVATSVVYTKRHHVPEKFNAGFHWQHNGVYYHTGALELWMIFWPLGSQNKLGLTAFRPFARRRAP